MIADQYDSFYLTPCGFPSLIDSQNAELDEVLIAYRETLHLLTCYATKHNRLVQQIEEKRDQ